MSQLCELEVIVGRGDGSISIYDFSGHYHAVGHSHSNKENNGRFHLEASSFALLTFSSHEPIFTSLYFNTHDKLG